jgi:Enoyl-(Acyl carrier protein) reductase
MLSAVSKRTCWSWRGRSTTVEAIAEVIDHEPSTRKEPHPCLTSEYATLATEEARSVTSPGPQVPARSMAATFQAAYSVDVISAIVVAQVAAPAMRAAGFGTIVVTGGGFADHPIPALATVSLGKAALRSAATMLGADLEPGGIRVATLTIAGQTVAGTSFAPEHIAERYWEVVHVDGPWQAEFRFTGE